jgi:hypothetical protein
MLEIIKTATLAALWLVSDPFSLVNGGADAAHPGF